MPNAKVGTIEYLGNQTEDRLVDTYSSG